MSEVLTSIALFIASIALMIVAVFFAFAVGVKIFALVVE